MMSPRTLLFVSVVAIGGMTASVASAQNAGQGPGDGTGPMAQDAQGAGPMGAGAPGPQGKGRGPMAGGVMFNLLDQDGDGSLNEAEIAALTASIVKTIDADGDGTLTQQEVGRVLGALDGRGGKGHEMRGPRGGGAEAGRGHHGGRGDMRHGPRGDRADHQRGPRDGHGPQRGPRAGGSEQQRMQFGQRLGIDADGLTQEEFLKRHEDRFAALDTNGDGTVTTEEFAAHMPQGPRGRGMR